MKKHRTKLLLTALMMISGVTLWGMNSPVNDIPVTTSSKEALQFVRQGLAMMDRGDGQKAKALFTRAIQKDPKLGIAYLLSANQANSPKEFTEYLKLAKANISGASQWEKWYYDYYATYLTSDWNKRLEIVTKIATTYPGAARPQVDLGNTFSESNDITHAREYFAKAIQLNPDWTGGYFALYQSYLFNEPRNFKMAEQNAKKVTILAPSSQGAEIALGDCYRAQNDLNKAKDAYSKAIALDPGTSEAYYKRGHANTFLGNYDEAKQDYMDGGKHDESLTMSNQFIGFTYLYSGDYKKAITWFTDLAGKADASGDSKDKIQVAKMTYYETLADIAFHYGDSGELLDVINRMEPLSMQMGSDVGTKEAALTQKSSILYWRSLLASLEGNYDEAKAKADEIKTTLAPVNDPSKLQNYEFAIGYLNLQQKNYSEAVSNFEKTDPGKIYNKFWLAKAYDAEGDKAKANSLFKEISAYNFNGSGYALVRNEVNQKLAMGK